MLLPKNKNSFHAHHSAIGAHSSFTIGMHGAKGGLALEQGQPAEGAVYIGTIEDDLVTVFPFFQPDDEIIAARFDHLMEVPQSRGKTEILQSDKIERDYRFASDRFTAGDMSLEVISPFYPLPDPAESDDLTNKRAACPAIFARLTVDNSQGSKQKTAFFSLGNHRCPMPVTDSEGFTAFLFQNGQLGMATKDAVRPFQCMDFSDIRKPLRAPQVPRYGPCVGFLMDVPPGETREMLVSLATYHTGRASFGIEMPYWYTRFFGGIREVLEYSLDNRNWYLEQAAARDEELEKSALNDPQKFLIAHASHSYYGSTQWFDHGGEPFWAVNEGEYRLINTFDLTVDMVFYEMRFSPWTVKNVLENFASHYSYYDNVRLPGGDQTYAGGVSFTHDMGNHNIFTPSGHSSYEESGIDRACFSYMTHEQLVNWICCAGVYAIQQDDQIFLARHLSLLEDCYQSMLNRDHPIPAQRNGVMGCESSRCNGGGEITTYDSLDRSLGQARNNLYLAVKSWAAYLALEAMFARTDKSELADQARASAALCAKTIASEWNDELGFIPAVFENGNRSAIIPAIEGLIFPKAMGLDDAISVEGPYSELILILKRHFEAVFRPGICLYEDNGWKLSSTADNSWMSKIMLCQHVARVILNIDFGEAQIAHDTAHMDWEIFGSTFSACSDQFTSGKAMASLYYPRIVTNILWMDEARKPVASSLQDSAVSTVSAVSTQDIPTLARA